MTKTDKMTKIKKGRTIRLSNITYYDMKISKKGQTTPVYSVYTNRAFERI
jgi:hypothetical protein